MYCKYMLYGRWTNLTTLSRLQHPNLHLAVSLCLSFPHCLWLHPPLPISNIWKYPIHGTNIDMEEYLLVYYRHGVCHWIDIDIAFTLHVYPIGDKI